MKAAWVIMTILAGFGAAVVITWLMYGYTQSMGMIDHPNPRSSHSLPVPRGGGLSISLIGITVIVLLALRGGIDSGGAALAIGLLLVTIAGWVDDRDTLHPALKMAACMVSGVIFVFGLGSIERVEMAGFVVPLGVLAPLLTMLWVAGLANAYNFMDGIDGLAAVQAAIAACTIGVWFALHGSENLALLCYAVMAASLGFLVWNWSPAKIFMGDVGSLFLGAVFAGLAIVGNRTHDIPVGAFVILFSVFIADTGVTFLKRLLAGKKVWQAHREHYYQRAVAAGWSHAQVTIAITLAGIGFALLATLEMLRAEPRWAWGIIDLILLAGLVMAIARKESAAGSTA